MYSSTLTHAIARLSLGVALAIGVAATHAESCDIVRATLAEPNAKTAEVSTQDVQRIMVDGTTIILDTRTPAEYAAGHIPGARQLAHRSADPVDAVTQMTGGDKGKALVLYCNGPHCQASRRLSEQLLTAGFTNVRRYQLGIPIWRALGGPTEINVDGLVRLHGRDQTAVFIDARSPEEFNAGSLPGARNLPVDLFVAGAVRQPPLPEDDFNTRVVLFGRDASQARALAEALKHRPWHNVSYVDATLADIRGAIK